MPDTYYWKKSPRELTLTDSSLTNLDSTDYVEVTTLSNKINTESLSIKSFIISHLRDYIRNQQGEATLLALVLIVITIAIMTKSITHMISHHKKTTLRLQTYLCFRSGLSNIKKSIHVIDKANHTILSLNALKILNPTPQWEILKRAAQVTQQLQTFRFYKDILTNMNCTQENKVRVLKSFPYYLSMVRILKRGTGGLALKNYTKKSFIVFARQGLLPVFRLEARYSTKRFKLIKTQERSFSLPTAISISPSSFVL